MYQILFLGDALTWLKNLEQHRMVAMEKSPNPSLPDQSPTLTHILPTMKISITH